MTDYEKELLDVIVDQSNKLEVVHTALQDILDQINRLRNDELDILNSIWGIDTFRAREAVEFRKVGC